MNLTKLTSAILLGAALLTGTVACSKQDNSTAQTSQTTSHKSTAAKSSDSSQTNDSSTETTNSVKTEIGKIKLTQQEAIDKFHSQFSGKQIKSIDLSLEGKQYVHLKASNTFMKLKASMTLMNILQKSTQKPAMPVAFTQNV